MKEFARLILHGSLLLFFRVNDKIELLDDGIDGSFKGQGIVEAGKNFADEVYGTISEFLVGCGWHFCFWIADT